MKMNAAAPIFGKSDYDLAFERECQQSYPEVAGLELSYQFAIDYQFLLAAARVLACPVKVNPPNWQHGRVLYSVLRDYFVRCAPGVTCILDIGTAKGFSAVCMARAVDDAGRPDKIISVDVIDPAARVRRNSVLEVSGAVLDLFTIEEFTKPYLDRTRPKFVGGGAKDLLLEAYKQDLHIGFAFVDGKHSHEAVLEEARMLSRVQRAGDVIIFDDTNLMPVRTAVSSLRRKYYMRDVAVLPARAYTVAIKK